MLCNIIQSTIMRTRCLLAQLEALVVRSVQQQSHAMPATSLGTGVGRLLESSVYPPSTLERRELHTATPSLQGQHMHASSTTVDHQHSNAALSGQLHDSISYNVQVTIKAFEKRYVEAASNTISDLMFVSFSPKQRQQAAGGICHSPSSLSMPTRSTMVPLDWKKSRFTVVRGPHIDKRGMEQFEMRRYKAVASISTPNPRELEWFLDSLKLYQFPGVQIQVNVTSNNYLTPTQLPEHLLNPTASLLADHTKHIAKYLTPQASAGASSSSVHSSQTAGSSDSLSATASEFRSMLGSLRQMMYAGFKQQRKQLSPLLNYKTWHATHRADASASTVHESELTRSSHEGIDHMLEGTAQSRKDGLLKQGQQDETAKEAAAFLAAAEAVFLNLKLDAVETFRHVNMHFTTYRVGKQEVPAAEWMQAVLQATHIAHALEKHFKEPELLAAHASYTLIAHSLLGQFFKLWMQQTSAAIKPNLALPSQELTTTMLQSTSRS